ncbi:hypothetical protein KKF34_14540 [Myxococcota bacterium]|nr:hypothetical protein [Myxococcota bacterium]MBU1383157.1 hypothetical protein [Myxococcota bacterium]MBU1498092.1 hypothetical protein [Myxococcota bacterium]
MADYIKIKTPKAADAVKCGLYRTTKELGPAVPAGVLVYYHNHGDPGPGVYPPEKWINNKAVFSMRGIPLKNLNDAFTLEPLPSEGFYRVTKDFYCCENHCRLIVRDTLVQLGYNGKGEPIVFIPEWNDDGVSLPERGTLLDEERLNYLKPLKLTFNFSNKNHSDAPEPVEEEPAEE